jgi:hypothetical protein
MNSYNNNTTGVSRQGAAGNQGTVGGGSLPAKTSGDEYNNHSASSYLKYIQKFRSNADTHQSISSA